MFFNVDTVTGKQIEQIDKKKNCLCTQFVYYLRKQEIHSLHKQSCLATSYDTVYLMKQFEIKMLRLNLNAYLSRNRTTHIVRLMSLSKMVIFFLHIGLGNSK